ncbi:hypothetical protein FBR02_06725 [Anaerolineae bacterium CFX9]|jgi:hypothetical protein|nr:hypothetical protein [Chloroflexota bacterium]MDL1900447.1 hypothetical protein [Anaerolineae bacterium CFX9]
MLQCQRQNFHHSKLPKPGAVGCIIGLSTVNPRRKCIVVAYPLCDSADYRYSIGIHTMFVRFLDNGEIARFSSIWFEALQ